VILADALLGAKGDLHRDVREAEVRVDLEGEPVEGDALRLDLLRLARATGALKSEADYDRYAYVTLTTGYPGEANAVLGEGIKAGVVDVAKSPFK
jgi:hypothetical protein